MNAPYAAYVAVDASGSCWLVHEDEQGHRTFSAPGTKPDGEPSWPLTYFRPDALNRVQP